MPRTHHQSKGSRSAADRGPHQRRKDASGLCGRAQTYQRRAQQRPSSECVRARYPLRENVGETAPQIRVRKRRTGGGNVSGIRDACEIVQETITEQSAMARYVAPNINTGKNLLIRPLFQLEPSALAKTFHGGHLPQLPDVRLAGVEN